MTEPDLSSALLDEKFISLATFKRSGEEVRTPLWFAEAGGRLYLRTLANSGKVKRIRNNGRVRIAPCDIAGKITGAWLDAEAHALAPGDATQERADRALDAKYGDERREMTRLMAEQGKPLEFIEIRPAASG
ncbi:MAG: PPOX class F420-dependent oxidoreductase [Deltaproteobacteria bacterium]|nr:PPOX class F420-dependent oxidoreductase [Deltaproteobacteria bacterium]MBW2417553.1 PPOX class F420-dependent oxidoreductase [Deltaproteobacteria bacterium]